MTTSSRPKAVDVPSVVVLADNAFLLTTATRRGVSAAFSAGCVTAGFSPQLGITPKRCVMQLTTSKILLPFSISENGFTQTSVRTTTDERPVSQL